MSKSAAELVAIESRKVREDLRNEIASGDKLNSDAIERLGMTLLEDSLNDDLIQQGNRDRFAGITRKQQSMDKSINRISDKQDDLLKVIADGDKANSDSIEKLGSLIIKDSVSDDAIQQGNRDRFAKIIVAQRATNKAIDDLGAEMAVQQKIVYIGDKPEKTVNFDTRIVFKRNKPTRVKQEAADYLLSFPDVFVKYADFIGSDNGE